MAKTARIFATIDVNYFDDDRVIEAGDAWQLHFAAILACKRNLSNGRMTPRQLTRFAPDSVPDVGAAIAVLIEVGLFTDLGGDVAVNGWADWNDSSEDIEAMSTGGLWGNHLRWHVKKKKKSEDCEYCFPRVASGGDSGGDQDPNPKADADTDVDPDLDVDHFVDDSRVPLLGALPTVSSSTPIQNINQLNAALEGVCPREAS